MIVNVFPTTCNICGGQVEYVPLTKVYGKYLKYGKKSGYCYHCKECDAKVGTHIDRPLEAYGILANREMSELRQKNHNMFDKFWRNKTDKTVLYHKLEEEMGIPFEECHFGYFTTEQLERSYKILIKWWRAKYDI